VSSIPPAADEPHRPEVADSADDRPDAALDAVPDDLPDAPLPDTPHPDATIERIAPVNRPFGRASNNEARRREAEEDREFILRAQNGDQAAFRRLVERHQRRAFAIAMGLVRDENDARELVQDAFLRVYRNLNSFQGGSSFFTWLYRIVTNL
jgi:RNA polymerase sigma-70 factor (ECF subfamily)